MHTIGTLTRLIRLSGLDEGEDARTNPRSRPSPAPGDITIRKLIN